MRSLFARIWVSYLLVVALTFGAAVAVSYGLAIRRAEVTDSLSIPALSSSAQAALSSRGIEGLGAWMIDQRHAHPEVHVYFVDRTGREVMSRALAGRPIQSGVGQPAPVVTASNGVAYRMYVRRTSDLAFGLWQITMMMLLLIGIAVSAAGCALLAHYLTRPVVRLRAGVRSIAAGGLDTRMDADIARRRDELGGLARDFDQMAADLRALIASKEGLLRDISHELRSPLARLRVAAGLARKGAPKASAEAFERIDREVERLDALIGQILRFSRLEGGPQPAREVFDLNLLLQDAAADAEIEAQAAGKSVVVALNARACVIGDPGLVRSAVENVLRNAVRFAPDASRVEVALDAADGCATISVADRGPGVAEGELPKIFEPFYRNAGSGGVGLGLAIACKVLELHGGALAAANRDGGGFVVRLSLPLWGPAAAASSRAETGKPRVPACAASATGE
jgi:two-component system sensor histidine kinase CpxA